MVVVETEGSYTNQITLDSLDVGQSYSVLVTADQITADYFIVASPKMSNATEISGLVGIGVLHYGNSTTLLLGLTHLISNSPSIKLNPLGSDQSRGVSLHLLLPDYG